MRRFLCSLTGHPTLFAVDSYLEELTGLFWRHCWCGDRDDRWVYP